MLINDCPRYHPSRLILARKNLSETIQNQSGFSCTMIVIAYLIIWAVIAALILWAVSPEVFDWFVLLIGAGMLVSLVGFIEQARKSLNLCDSDIANILTAKRDGDLVVIESERRIFYYDRTGILLGRANIKNAFLINSCFKIALQEMEKQSNSSLVFAYS